MFLILLFGFLRCVCVWFCECVVFVCVCFWIADCFCLCVCFSGYLFFWLYVCFVLCVCVSVFRVHVCVVRGFCARVCFCGLGLCVWFVLWEVKIFPDGPPSGEQLYNKVKNNNQECIARGKSKNRLFIKIRSVVCLLFYVTDSIFSDKKLDFRNPAVQITCRGQHFSVTRGQEENADIAAFASAIHIFFLVPRPKMQLGEILQSDPLFDF